MNRPRTAGLALVRHGRLLLVHPTGGRRRQSWSLPKGHLERGETVAQGALREVGEEVGLEVSPYCLVGRPHCIGSKLCFWVVDVSHVGLPEVLPRDWLQAAEVDHARFVSLSDARRLLRPWMRPVASIVAREVLG